jgi:hypothetical protein
MLNSESQRISITRRQQRRFSPTMLAINWPHGVDHVARWQLAGGSNYRFASRQAILILAPPERAAVCQYPGSTGLMNRTVNAATTKQCGIRGIHNRVDLLTRDVAKHYGDSATQEGL